MASIRIGLAQARQVDDLQINARTVFRFMEEAAARGVQILCFPETHTVGYRVDVTPPPPERPVPVDHLSRLHQQVAERCGELGMACVLGTEIPNPEDPVLGKPYNSALVVSEKGQVLGAHHKVRLTPLDATAYSPGTRFETYELWGVRVGVVICFEGFRFPEATRECVSQGAQIIIHPQNNTTRPAAWKIPIHRSLILARAAENTVWVASCNCCYEEHQNSTSLVVAPDGRVVGETGLGEETLLVRDIDPEQATRALFLYDLEGCAPILFGDQVRREEFAHVLEPAG